jgi:hypothetical protein
VKKKELVGDFKNDGRECRPQGDPEEVRVHAGWVSVGIDHDTVEFPVQTIRSWRHSIKRRGKSVQTTGASSVHSSGFTSRACDRSAKPCPATMLHRVKIDLPKRSFFVVRHRERYASQAEKALFASFRM